MWTLLLSRQADPPGSFIDRRQLDAGAIRIGRDAAKADWAIPDPSGQISRLHCTVSAVGLELFVTDTSTNGVSLNQPQQRISPNMPVPIRVRDKLLLGDFAIEVATEAAGLAASIQPQAAWPAPQQQPGFSQPDPWFGGGAQDSIWGPGAPPQSDVHEFLGDVLHDFLAPPQASAAFSPSEPWGGPLSDAFSKPILGAPVAPAASGFSIPEDWAVPPSGAAQAGDPFASMGDPFGATGAAASAPRPASSPRQPSADPFAGFGSPPPVAGPFAGFENCPQPSSDPFAQPAQAPFAADAFPSEPQPARAPAPAPAPDPFTGFQTSELAATAPEKDPFALPPAAPPPLSPASFPDQPSPARILPGRAPHVGKDPFAIPANAVPSSPNPAGSESRPGIAPAPAAAESDSWAAFCEGAGLDPGEVRASPDAMRRLGVLYRQVVLGLSDLIQDRAAFKNEFRVERTMIGIGHNNPLKHLPALDTAKLLLGDPLPGFMPADDAVRTAFEDVKKHQLAMLAGVQHALRAVFDRLAPGEVERIMTKAEGQKRGLFQRPDPWSVYKAVFEALQTDAASNVNSVMSLAFREGYERFLSGQG